MRGGSAKPSPPPAFNAIAHWNVGSILDQSSRRGQRRAGWPQLISAANAHNSGFTKCARGNLVRVPMRGAPAKLRPSPTQSRRSLELGRHFSPKAPLRSEVASRVPSQPRPHAPSRSKAATQLPTGDSSTKTSVLKIRTDRYHINCTGIPSTSGFAISQDNPDRHLNF